MSLLASGATFRSIVKPFLGLKEREKIEMTKHNTVKTFLEEAVWG